MFLIMAGDLKRICETELGLISQCCLTKHVFKISKQYLANVSLKINVKVNTFYLLNLKYSMVLAQLISVVFRWEEGTQFY